MRKKPIFLLIFTLLFNLAFSITVHGNSEKSTKEIVIDIPSRKLYLKENNVVIKEYPVGVGKAHSQTPLGSFKIGEKLIDRPYYTQKIPGGSPNNPLGSRWIEFHRGAYAIHGNANPSSIGGYVSGGCVRMFERDVQELYEEVTLGVPVKVVYEPIKKLYDTEGKDPILWVYPDEYRKVSNLHKDIKNTLSEIGLLNNITSTRLEELNSHVNRWNTIYSDNWTYFINDHYITKDVVVDNGIFVNKSKIEKFFNIKMDSIEGEEYSSLFGNKVKERVINNKKYILAGDLEKILGGSHKTEEDIMRFDYKLNNFILVNGTLVLGLGESSIEKENTVIPLDSIIDPLGMEVKNQGETKEVFYKGNEIKYFNKGNTAYVALKDIEKNVEIDINTSKSFIKLMGDVYIVKDSDDSSNPPEPVDSYNSPKTEIREINNKLYLILLGKNGNIIRNSYLYDIISLR